MSVEGYLRSILEGDVRYGYLDRSHHAARQFHPEIVVNSDAGSMLRVLREELARSSSFSFSVAFVTPRAIALLKQEFVDFRGQGQIVTSDYLGFNSPEAFAELRNLEKLGIRSRLHTSTAYHPKAYVFESPDRVTAILGSSNLTEAALVSNHEWNIRVTAAAGSDLAGQLKDLVAQQDRDSVAITDDWLDRYAAAYRARSAVVAAPDRIPVEFDTTAAVEAEQPDPLLTQHEELVGVVDPLVDNDRIDLGSWPDTPVVSGQSTSVKSEDSESGPSASKNSGLQIVPNSMQEEALSKIAAMRDLGAERALVISATGTGKTILSALDVRAVNPRRMLFVVHREQILDKAISEFKKVLDAPDSDYGKLVGGTRQGNRRFVFATVQTLSQPDTLSSFDPRDFDYVLVDEVHRAGAKTYTQVLNYLKPEFLLGMTATPERTDGFNVFELFDFNVPYEIRLSRALEEEMLSPFHYYGITDATFDDHRTASVDTGLSDLVSQVRVDHIVDSLETYAQAGVAPRGLIFCSRVTEAVALSEELNQTVFRGRRLRTRALSGMNSIEERERAVRDLEHGALDYLLTVDVFNEGVDIPSVNQVVMLRQTQSAIVFVQQLGRGLRKHPGKEYVVVIDFIGNYANNYLIPVALFGDESLNKESLRKNLLAAEETGVIAGLSSVRFDKISQARVLRSIGETKLDSAQHLKAAFELLRNRLGKPPALADFYRFESADPVLVATKYGNYVRLVEKFAKQDLGLSETEHLALDVVSQEALAAKRVHELVVLSKLVQRPQWTVPELFIVIAQDGWALNAEDIDSALAAFTLTFHTEQEVGRYKRPVAIRNGDTVGLSAEVFDGYRRSTVFRGAVDDLIGTGLDLIQHRYGEAKPFVPGMQYSRKDACRLLGWRKNVSSTIYGYKVDKPTKTCPIFVTYHKADHVTASTAYEDELLDRRTMLWYTRSRRTLASDEVRAIVDGDVDVHVFAKKDDAEGTDFFYLGQATAHDAEQASMNDDKGKTIPVVRMNLIFDEPIDTAVYDYFHPTVMI